MRPSAIRRHALDLAAFAWGVAEATLFFLVPDVLLSYVGLTRGVTAAVRACVAAALGASVGGGAMYLWSLADPERARDAVLAVPAISAAMVASAEAGMASNWFVATFLGPLTSTPFKVYAILAPSWAPLPAFVLATVLVRLPRFLVVSIGVALAGRMLSRWLDERRRVLLLAVAWCAFYAAFFVLMPG